CGTPVTRDSPESAAAACLAARPGSAALVVFALPIPTGLPWDQAREGLQAAGFVRVLEASGVARLEEMADRPEGDTVTVVQDRVTLRAADRGRLVESLEQAFRHGRGRASVLPVGDAADALRFSTALACARCDFTVREATPNLFSF